MWTRAVQLYGNFAYDNPSCPNLVPSWDLKVTGFSPGLKPPRTAPGVEEHSSQCKTAPDGHGVQHRTGPHRTHCLASEPRYLKVTGFSP